MTAATQIKRPRMLKASFQSSSFCAVLERVLFVGFTSVFWGFFGDILEEFDNVHDGDDGHEDEEDNEGFGDDGLFPFFA